MSSSSKHSAQYAVRVSFPNGAKSYKEVLSRILNLGDTVNYSGPLVLKYKSSEEARKKLEIISKIGGGKNKLSAEIPKADNINPLKRFFRIPYGAETDEASIKKFFGATFIQSTRSRNSRAYILSFPSEKAAENASTKSMSVVQKVDLLPCYESRKDKSNEQKKRPLESDSSQSQPKKLKTDNKKLNIPNKMVNNRQSDSEDDDSDDEDEEDSEDQEDEVDDESDIEDSEESDEENDGDNRRVGGDSGNDSDDESESEFEKEDEDDDEESDSD